MSEKYELVSIIVPVYNVEKYINRCVDSLCVQTYSNIEIILIDDGSSDDSGDLCDYYAGIDERIRVIHKKNSGVSEARNQGISSAEGQYILFVDSDDYVSSNIIETLYNAIQKYSLDISACFFKRVLENAILDERNIDNSDDYDIDICTGKEIIERIYHNYERNIELVVWNKMYKRELFDKYEIVYPKGRYHEDIFVTYKLLYYALRVGIVQKELYYYRTRPGSIMTVKFSEKQLDGLDAKEEAITFFQNNNEEKLMKIVINDYFASSIKLFAQAKMLQDLSLKKKCEKYILQKYNKIWKRYSNKVNSKLKKVIYSNFRIWPVFVAEVYKKIKK